MGSSPSEINTEANAQETEESKLQEIEETTFSSPKLSKDSLNEKSRNNSNCLPNTSMAEKAEEESMKDELRSRNSSVALLKSDGSFSYVKKEENDEIKEKSFLQNNNPSQSSMKDRNVSPHSELTPKESLMQCNVANSAKNNTGLTNLVKKISNFLMHQKFECPKIEEAGENGANDPSDDPFTTRMRFFQSKKFSRGVLNPVITAYPESQRSRRPFMSQPTGRSDRNARMPNPPSYYTSSVTQERHQPLLLLDSGSLQREGRIENQETGTQGRKEIVLRQNFQQDDITMMPNVTLNFSFWAPYPDNIPSNVPACLAHLVAADSLFIIQKMDVIELFMDITEPNYYLIQNTSGQCLYYVYETTNLCLAGFCKNSRGLQLHVMDMYHNEIIYINKPCGCNDCFCCYPVLEVYSPPLVPVGAVTQKYNFCGTEFTILDADENKVFTVHGPSCCVTSCYGEADFTIHALDWQETEIGIIRRQFGNITTTYYTNTDYYGISFPVDLDVRVKAVFLGALFLIEYTYYDTST